jgi:hypothetical protein
MFLVLVPGTHVSLEIVVLHSVICHVCLSSICSMVNGSTGAPMISGEFDSRY